MTTPGVCENFDAGYSGAERSASLRARRVEYPEEKPAAYTAEGWVELLSLQTKIAAARILEVATHTKSQDWS